MSEYTNTEIVTILGGRAAEAHANLSDVLDMVTAYRAEGGDFLWPNGGDFLWPNGVRGNVLDAMDCLAIIAEACK